MDIIYNYTRWLTYIFIISLRNCGLSECPALSKNNHNLELVAADQCHWQHCLMAQDENCLRLNQCKDTQFRVGKTYFHGVISKGEGVFARQHFTRIGPRYMDWDESMS